MIRWAEVAYATRSARKTTRLAVVFHTEGLVSDRVFLSLKQLGAELHGDFRPLLALTTPFCPQYLINPLKDPTRTNFTAVEATNPTVADFEAKLKALSKYFDFGYHGHFFSILEGSCSPAFNSEVIRLQFDRECNLLTQIGFRPSSYAGGWWFLSDAVVERMVSWGFRFDSTLNDVHQDSFSRPQPFESAPLGEPFWLAKGIVEVPSIRSFRDLVRAATGSRNRTSFLVISLHDYDLVSPRTHGIPRLLANAFRKKRFVVDAERLFTDAKLWLED